MDSCRSCKAPIIWAATVAGKRMPVDAKPLTDPPHSDAGVFVLLRRREPEPLALPLVGVSALSLEAAERQGVPLFVSHFSTCEQADKWRR